MIDGEKKLSDARHDIQAELLKKFIHKISLGRLLEPN